MDKDLLSIEYLTPVFWVSGDTALIHYALDPSNRAPNRYVFITGFWKEKQAVQYRQELARIAAPNMEPKFLYVRYSDKTTLPNHSFHFF